MKAKDWILGVSMTLAGTVLAAVAIWAWKEVAKKRRAAQLAATTTTTTTADATADADELRTNA